MSREIVRVPPNWVQPQYQNPYRGLVDVQIYFDESLDEAVARWRLEMVEWKAKTPEDERKHLPTWVDVNDKEDRPEKPENEDGIIYRPWKSEDATWWQLWQTVGQGSPVTPPFETKEELISYLAEWGDYSDQGRHNSVEHPSEFTKNMFGDKPPAWLIEQRAVMQATKYKKAGWGHDRAKRFVEAGWAPTAISTNGEKPVEGKFVIGDD